MRKTSVIVLCAVLAWAAWLAWPLVDLHKISRAVADRNASELAQRMDLPSLKRSLIEQVGRTYLRVSGKDQGLSEFQIQMALRVAAGIADARIHALLEPENLLDLLSEGGTTKYADVGISAPRLEAPNLKNLWRIFWNTERFGRDFSIIMPLAADMETGYRIHLRLQDWRWKLSGIGLPSSVLLRIAREIDAEQKRS